MADDKSFLSHTYKYKVFFSGGGGGRGDWGRNEFRFYKGDRSIGGEIKNCCLPKINTR